MRLFILRQRERVGVGVLPLINDCFTSVLNKLGGSVNVVVTAVNLVVACKLN